MFRESLDRLCGTLQVRAQEQGGNRCDDAQTGVGGRYTPDTGAPRTKQRHNERQGTPPRSVEGRRNHEVPVDNGSRRSGTPGPVSGGRTILKPCPYPFSLSLHRRRSRFLGEGNKVPQSEKDVRSVPS